MNSDDVRRLIRKACAEAGSQRAFARGAGCSAMFVTDVLSGRREPSGPVLRALGLERVTQYRVSYRKSLQSEGSDR